MSRVIAVTPAGRRAYLELLAHYIVADDGIAEWQLWDNCRTLDDRAFLDELAARHGKIRVVRREGRTGFTAAINKFYAGCVASDAFYIKVDDDIVWLPQGFGSALAGRAERERGRYTWWSPLVVNNAICSWLMANLGHLALDVSLSALADDPIGWRSGTFARALHGAFIDSVQAGRLDRFATPDAEVSLGRFSINCIGFFGADAAAMGDAFCPPNVNDEDWISAVLPARTGRPGRVIGDLVASHFAFFTQEKQLRRTDLLARYYAVAGRTPALPLAPGRGSIRDEISLWWHSRETPIHIGWRDTPLGPKLLQA